MKIIPHSGDIHTDHQIVNKALLSATKSFRCPFIKRILSYETLSETDFNLNPYSKFIPNVFIDISHYIEEKLKQCIYTPQKLINFLFLE